jgi:hypothetical protein
VPAHNGPPNPQVVADWAANRRPDRKEARDTGFGIRWWPWASSRRWRPPPRSGSANSSGRWQIGGFALLGAYADLITDVNANVTAAEFVAEKIRGIVKDPAVAEKLVPKTYPIGSKRMLRRHRLLRRPSTATTSASSTCATSRSRRSRRPACGPRRASTRRRPSSTPSASTP